MFERAYTPVGSTTPSHASILTGLYPDRHGLLDNGRFFLRDEQTSIAEVLASRGYGTAAFVTAYTVDHRFGLAQGFEIFRDKFRRSIFSAVRFFRGIPLGDDRLFDRTADETVLEALEWIHQAPGAPSFLWVHLFDPHEPYWPPFIYTGMPKWRKVAKQTYDGEIAYLDFVFGKLSATIYMVRSRTALGKPRSI